MKRATFRLRVEPEGFGWDGTWHCYHDDQLLGWRYTAPMAIMLQPDLVALHRAIDGLPVFGLSARTHRLGKSTRTRTADMPGLPVIVYCPRPGCGRSQRVDKVLA